MKDLFERLITDFEKEMSKLPTMSKNYLSKFVDQNHREDDKNYYIDFALSGMAKEDIKISIVDDILNISATKNEKSEYCSFHKEFTKRIRLSDDDLNLKAVNADMKNGVLTVTIPKKTQSTSEKIDIEIK